MSTFLSVFLPKTADPLAEFQEFLRPWAGPLLPLDSTVHIVHSRDSVTGEMSDICEELKCEVLDVVTAVALDSCIIECSPCMTLQVTADKLKLWEREMRAIGWRTAAELAAGGADDNVEAVSPSDPDDDCQCELCKQRRAVSKVANKLGEKIADKIASKIAELKQRNPSRHNPSQN